MNTQTMTPKAVHPTDDLTSAKTMNAEGYNQYASKSDGFVIICNDNFSYPYITDPAMFAQLKLWNAAIIINSTSYTRVSHKETSRGSYRSTYLPGEALGSL